MELIDRRKLVDDFWKGVEDGSILSYEDTDNLMENAPTVDAVEVVHGRWVQHKQSEEVFVCSECCLNIANFEMRWLNYCPNCGADMRGDGNG